MRLSRLLERFLELLIEFNAVRAELRILLEEIRALRKDLPK